MRLAALFLLVSFVRAEEPSLERNGWWIFRDIVNDRKAGTLARGMGAFFFHDWDMAEKQLRRALRPSLPAGQAKGVRNVLSLINSMRGRHRRSGDDAIAAALSRYPDQRVTHRHARVRYTRDWAGHLVLPISINGQAAPCILDTGSGDSDLSEAMARRLGLEVHKVEVKIPTGDGRGALNTKGVAVARDVALGDFHLSNVAFMVRREMDGADKGIIGMNVFLAFETLAWSADGTLEVGFPAGRRNPRAANLAMNFGTLITEAEFDREPLTFMLDTGSGDASLLQNSFGQKFPALLRDFGAKTSYDPGFMGRPARAEPAVMLPELVIRTGGCDAVLRNAPVLVKPLFNSPWLFGIMGMDVLDQAQRVSLDFRAMRLTLEGCNVN